MGQEQPIAPSIGTPIAEDNGGHRLMSPHQGNGAGAKSREVRQPFPCKVYAMLEDAEEKGFDDVVSWNNRGDGFTVHNKERFTKEIVPKYYNQTRYKSFQRQLSLYGFERSTAGENKGLRYHEKLRRGCKHLCREMKPVGYKPRGQEQREKLRHKVEESATASESSGSSSSSSTSSQPDSIAKQGIPAVISSNSIYKENPQVPQLVYENSGFSMSASVRPCSHITERLVTTDHVAVFEGMPFYLMTTLPTEAQQNGQGSLPSLPPLQSTTEGMDGQMKKAWEIGFKMALTMNPKSLPSPPEVVPTDTITDDLQL